ncbi:PREDICTED: uncharacterized protein LOC109220821 [Nicotiana attenuata]|uniref:Uncharacterized protein n=1 Tax=Nicotiana attenuata TaxID=49451 RepID=A0A1J6KAU5_NICAT|nr:PREDICTED: uncharacterized protein LOC109220821 [Nicotiana attenuata]OIT19947.1 hypothetical protein A4A49_39600 [Nicotiana attenuata]
MVQNSQNSDVQQSQVSDVQHSQVSDVLQSQASNKVALTAFKRPRVLGHGVFVSKSGYTCVEQGRPVSRVIDSGKNNGAVASSAVVTGDLGYKPSKGLKWKEKQAITTTQLQHRSILLQYLRSKSPKANEKIGGF